MPGRDRIPAGRGAGRARGQPEAVEAAAIAAADKSYEDEQKVVTAVIGQDFLNGVFPYLFLSNGSTAKLTFSFIDPATGLPTTGTSIGSVVYEQSQTPDIPDSFTMVGMSTDATNHFLINYQVGSSEQDIRAIPFDLSGLPISISGVGGENVAVGDVVQLQTVPEPSALTLTVNGALVVLGSRYWPRRAQ
jgi:hypothetical protein